MSYALISNPEIPAPPKGDLFEKLHSQGWLEPLLADKTTGKPIIWATDTYADLGKSYGKRQAIKPELLVGRQEELAATRSQKRLQRTRKHGEVATPPSVCKMMCDHASDALGTSDWQEFVAAKVLEITCGTAPFLASPQNCGEAGVGLLDRKLKLVDENTKSQPEWLEWAYKAYESTYGYEFQGDNLLLARINLLETFRQAYFARFGEQPTSKHMARLIDILAWNLWQMDGLTGAIPFAEAPKPRQVGLFDNPPTQTQPAACKIKNWQTGQSIPYPSLEQAMKFDFIIGNPPYQEEAPGTSTSDIPVYHIFMDEVYKMGSKVELITPGRFLFNAGATPERWNQKMLNNDHLSVLHYEDDTSKVFPGVELPGGIAVTYYDPTKKVEPIVNFIPFQELISIKNKVLLKNNKTINSIMYTQNRFNLTKLYKDFPEMESMIGNNGKDKRFRQAVLERFTNIFTEDKGQNSLRILGLIGRKRVYRYINRYYVENDDWIDHYKVFVPFSNGASGTLGDNSARLISKPVIGYPKDGITQTFIGVGNFETEIEANNLLKYINSKFARVLLGILKVTQGNKAETWKYVPLQDFTPASDIDWDKSIPEIDAQLYAKYGLDQAEIDFIESHVREMD